MAWDSDPDLETFFAEFVALATEGAPVTVLLSDDQSPERVLRIATDFGADTSRLRILEAGVDSVWVRDYGPLVVQSGNTRKVVNMQYFGEAGDNLAPRFMADDEWKLPTVELPLDMEGGNLLSDGAGRCLTTETLIQENGHKYTTRAIHDHLARTLGCKDLVVLAPLAGEPTGHVDMFATLTAPGEVIVGEIFANDHENARLLDENTELLEGAGFKVRRVPMPGHSDGLFRSYTNALAINDVVIVPVYPEDDEYEEVAMRVFEEAYPDRSILPIIASEIIEKFGAVHCVGMTIAK